MKFVTIKKQTPIINLPITKDEIEFLLSFMPSGEELSRLKSEYVVLRNKLEMAHSIRIMIFSDIHSYYSLICEVEKREWVSISQIRNGSLHKLKQEYMMDLTVAEWDSFFGDIINEETERYALEGTLLKIIE